SRRRTAEPLDSREDVMQFGFTLKPESSIERTLALTRQAEAAGFDSGWLFDSHVLWREPYVLLTLMAQASTRLRPGPCGENPHPPAAGPDPRRPCPCSTGAGGGGWI